MRHCEKCGCNSPAGCIRCVFCRAKFDRDTVVFVGTVILCALGYYFGG